MQCERREMLCLYTKKPVVVLEGIPGVGKSTLASRLQTLFANSEATDALNVTLDFIPEPTCPELLELFYKNPQRTAFALQIEMLKRRLDVIDGQKQKPTNDTTKPNSPNSTEALIAKMQCMNLEMNLNIPHNEHRESLLDLLPFPNADSRAPLSLGRKKTPCALQERDLFGDLCFALANYIQGSISEDEIKFYMHKLGADPCDPHSLAAVANGHCTEKCIMLLVDDPSLCRDRIKLDEARNEFERKIDVGYLKCLEDVYFHIFVKQLLAHGLCRIKVLPWDAYGKESMLFSMARRIEESARGSDSASYADFQPPLDLDNAGTPERKYANAWEKPLVYTRADEGKLSRYWNMIRTTSKNPKFYENMHPYEKESAMQLQMEIVCIMRHTKDVYFHENMALRPVAQLESSHGNKHVNRYRTLGVRLYEPYYIGMVYWHLSMNHRVHFVRDDTETAR